MAKITILEEGSNPSTPATNTWVLFFKSDGLYIKDDTGAVTGPFGGPPFTDTNALVKGSGDATKLIRFEVDGLTTATTRVITVPDSDMTLSGIALTQTLTNKRITKRVVTTTQSATPTINTDNGDIFVMTGLAQAITSLTTNLSGTPTQGQFVQMNITDNGTGRAITPGASFAGTAEFSLSGLTTTANKRLLLLWQYSSALSKWVLVGKLNDA